MISSSLAFEYDDLTMLVSSGCPWFLFTGRCPVPQHLSLGILCQSTRLEKPLAQSLLCSYIRNRSLIFSPHEEKMWNRGRFSALAEEHNDDPWLEMKTKIWLEMRYMFFRTRLWCGKNSCGGLFTTCRLLMWKMLNGILLLCPRVQGSLQEWRSHASWLPSWD